MKSIQVQFRQWLVLFIFYFIFKFTHLKNLARICLDFQCHAQTCDHKNSKIQVLKINTYNHFINKYSTSFTWTILIGSSLGGYYCHLQMNKYLMDWVIGPNTKFLSSNRFVGLNGYMNFNFDDNKQYIKGKMINIYFKISPVFEG